MDDGPQSKGIEPRLIDATPEVDAALHLIADAVVAVDNRFRVTFINAAAERQYGILAEHILGRPLREMYRYEWLDPGDRAFATQALSERGEWRGETLHLTRDGRRLHVELRVTALRNAHGERAGLLGEIRNITELRRIEERLRASETRHRLLADTLPHGVVHQGADGEIIDMNPAAQRILGKSRERFLGSNSEREEGDTIREDGSAFPGIEHPTMVALRTGRVVRGVVMGVYNPQRRERRWIKIDAVPVFAAGEERPREVYGLFEDITEQRAAAAELLRAKELADAINLINEAVHSTLDSTAIAQRLLMEGSRALASDSAAISLRVNGAWMVSQLHELPAELLGTSMTDEQERHAVLAVQTREVVAIEERSRDRRCNLAHLESSGIHSVIVAPLIIRNAPFGVVFFNYHRGPRTFSEAERNFARQLAATASVALENARLLAESQQTAAALREADQRKDVFLATLAHELRNPLAPIRTAAQLLESEQLSDEQLAYCRGVIKRQVSQMAHLLDDLLDIARITRGALALKIQPTCLRQAIEAALEAARPQIDARGHVVALDVPAGRLELTADPIRLTQILTNLLTNAAKYTPAGGRIEITVREDAGHWNVSVRDNGIGISPQLLPRVFTMFVQADDAGGGADGGLGIGLALIKGLVELHHGSIEADSAGRGRGSEFRVRLPRAGTAVAAEEPRPAAIAAPAAGARRVLIADDNRDGAQSLALLLEAGGHQVRVVHLGKAALEQAQSLNPEVMLLDIGMPDVNGYEVAREVRKQPWGRDVLLLAMTGWGREGDKLRAFDAGFDHHLTKPVDLAHLERLVNEARRSPNAS